MLQIENPTSEMMATFVLGRQSIGAAGVRRSKRIESTQGTRMARRTVREDVMTQRPIDRAVSEGRQSTRRQKSLRRRQRLGNDVRRLRHLASRIESPASIVKMTMRFARSVIVDRRATKSIIGIAQSNEVLRHRTTVFVVPGAPRTMECAMRFARSHRR